MLYRIFICFFLLLTSQNCAFAATVEVCPNCNTTSVAQAINIAQPCDTVLVQAGTYHEPTLLIDKPLFLIGRNFPILDGQEKVEIISVQASQVVIDGFQIINAAFSSSRELAGINVMNAGYIQISNNRLNNTCFGIYLANVNNSAILNNTLQAQATIELSAGNGIHAWKCNNLLINGNTVTGHRDGIYFEFVTYSSIINNHSHKNLRYGLHFMFSNNDRYQNNIFENNGAGVAVMYSNKVTMINNHFVHNWGDSAYGLLLKDIADSHIEGNLFEENTTGIHMEGSSRMDLIYNTFTQNGWAVQLQASCDNNDFSNNNFTGNTFDIATNGTLVLNKINHNFWDKYEGYDLNKDGIGDVPYRPVSLYSMLVAEMPFTIMLWRSFVVYLIDRMEKLLPSLTPENMLDSSPLMKKVNYDTSKST
ncbi:nitrous oxide reductase family maturation protein NosD [Sphingobacteriales bacterium UPWRP_1]|nr:nitrous oxide reductase [Sphingobacteriales bacterium TSM_CSS]PSJ77546.1 nitrous oxide reductase family maturation protein NosD [Sphingobacteriales bacterium UPWRP_1]